MLRALSLAVLLLCTLVAVHASSSAFDMHEVDEHDVSELFVAATDPVVSYTGRVYGTTNSTVQFDWSGILIEVQFVGTSLSVSLIDGGNEYNVYVDVSPANGGVMGLKPTLILKTTAGPLPKTYMLASNLNQGQHVVSLVKRTEALFKVVTLQGFTVGSTAGHAQVMPVSRPRGNGRRIEFIGDSITCGYGNEGVAPCNFSADTENEYEAYAYMTARYFGAEVSLTCWSGMGMVRNYADKNPVSQTPFPKLYPFILGSQPVNPWNFAFFVPDVVVLNLGTNDYSTEPSPPAETFVSAYVDFISYLRTKYGSSPHILAVCGPMIGDPCCQNVRHAVSQAGGDSARVYYVDLHVLNEQSDFGCDSHPSVQGHTKMFGGLAPTIRSVTGWA